ncbi:hypothetical protein GQ457_13G015190 [Hibiscus cannabinus]
MLILCFFFVKKQGKLIWEVRTRNWKLREGESRLSGLLEGISVSGNVFTRLSSGLMSSYLCISGLEYRYQHGGIGTDSSLESVYRYSHIGTGTVSLWYRYLYMGIDTDRLWYRYLV